MPQERLKKLHEGVSQTLDIGTYDDFATAMLDTTRRKLFHEKVSEFVDIGDYDSFNTIVDSEIASMEMPTPGVERQVAQPQKEGPITIDEELAYQFTGEQLLQKVPILGGVFAVEHSLELLSAANRLKTGDYEPKRPPMTAGGPGGYGQAYFWRGPYSKEQDVGLITEYLERAIAEHERGMTFGAKVAQGLAILPTWAIEFALTGGLANVGSAAVKKGLTKMLKSYATTRVGRAALSAAGWAGGAITRATLGLPTRITEKMTGKQVEVALGLREKENWATSFANSWGETVIEAASEAAGDAITKGMTIPLKALMKVTPFGRRFLTALEAAWTQHTGRSSVQFAKKLFAKGGYSNIVGELGEESLEKILMAITDLEDFGAGKDADVFERLGAAIRADVQAKPVEAIVLSVPMATKGAVSMAGERRYRNKVKKMIAEEERTIKDLNMYFDIASTYEKKKPPTREAIDRALEDGHVNYGYQARSMDRTGIGASTEGVGPYLAYSLEDAYDFSVYFGDPVATIMRYLYRTPNNPMRVTQQQLYLLHHDEYAKFLREPVRKIDPLWEQLNKRAVQSSLVDLRDLDYIKRLMDRGSKYSQNVVNDLNLLAAKEYGRQFLELTDEERDILVSEIESRAVPFDQEEAGQKLTDMLLEEGYDAVSVEGGPQFLAPGAGDGVIANGWLTIIDQDLIIGDGVYDTQTANLEMERLANRIVSINQAIQLVSQQEADPAVMDRKIAALQNEITRAENTITQLSSILDIEQTEQAIQGRRLLEEAGCTDIKLVPAEVLRPEKAGQKTEVYPSYFQFLFPGRHKSHATINLGDVNPQTIRNEAIRLYMNWMDDMDRVSGQLSEAAEEARGYLRELTRDYRYPPATPMGLNNQILLFSEEKGEDVEPYDLARIKRDLKKDRTLYVHMTPSMNVGNVLAQGLRADKFGKGIGGQRYSQAHGISVTRSPALIKKYHDDSKKYISRGTGLHERLANLYVRYTGGNILDLVALGNIKIKDLASGTWSVMDIVTELAIEGVAPSSTQSESAKSVSSIVEKYGPEDEISDADMILLEETDVRVADVPDIYIDKLTGGEKDPMKITKKLQAQGYDAINYYEELKIFKEEHAEVIGEVPDSLGMMNILADTAEEHGVPEYILMAGISESVGIKDVLFNGINDITERQFERLVKRIKRINPEWSDESKLHYIKYGDLPMEDVGITGPLAIGKGGTTMHQLRWINWQLFQSMETTLRRLGPIGDELVERTLDATTFRDNESAKALHNIRRAFAHFSHKEMRAFIKAVENGTVLTINKKFSNAYAIYRKEMARIDEFAKLLDYQTRRMDGKLYDYQGLGERFWPHLFRYSELRSAKKRERLIRSWMKELGISRAEANQRLDWLRDQAQRRKMGNIEYAREFDARGWEGDPIAEKFSKHTALAALERYVVNAYASFGERVYFDEGGHLVFGEEWETVNELIAKEGDPEKLALYQKVITKIRGMEEQARENPIIGSIRNYHIIRLLGLAQVPNAFQTSITVMPKAMTLGVTKGIKVLAQGMNESFRNPDFAVDEVGAAVIQNMREITGLSTRGVMGKAAAHWLRLTGFSGTETANNIIAASVGKFYVQELFKMAKGERPNRCFPLALQKGKIARNKAMAEAELRKLGIDPVLIEGQDALTDTQIKKAAWRMARLTQFRGGAVDLPMLWTTSYGKMIFQFKTFSFNIVKLAHHHFTKPALQWVYTRARHPLSPSKWRGTILPLLTYLASSMIAGEAIAYIRQTLLRGRERSENLLERALEDIMYAGTLGLWMDVYMALRYGGAEGFMGFVFGPTATWGAEIAEDLFRGEVDEALKKQVPLLRAIDTERQSGRENF